MKNCGDNIAGIEPPPNQNVCEDWDSYKHKR